MSGFMSREIIGRVEPGKKKLKNNNRPTPVLIYGFTPVGEIYKTKNRKHSYLY